MMVKRKWILPLLFSLVVVLLVPAAISAQTTPTPRPTSTPRVTGTPRTTATAISTPEATGESTSTPESTAEATAEATDSGLDCPSIVRAALDVVQEACSALGNDEICYGYLVLEASPRTGVQDFRFVRPGDIVDVIDVESLRLNALDVQRGVWGVVLLKVADINNPQAEPATMLLFGDVNLVSNFQFVAVTVNAGINVRAEPSTDAPVISALLEGTSIITSGRTPEGDWLRVRVTDTNGQPTLGWISAEYVTPDGDLSVLPEVSPDDPVDLSALNFGPMQAFSLTTGVNDAACSEAPNSGILIQTPEGQASVTVQIDEVVITVDGTSFIQAEADGQLGVNQIEGSAQVTAEGETSVAVAGTTVSVDLDENGAAVSAPSAPVTTDSSVVQALPVEVLPGDVTVGPPLEIVEGQPIAGNWQFLWGVSEQSCPNGQRIPFDTAGVNNPISMQGSTLIRGGVPYTFDGSNYLGSYSDPQGNLHQITLTVEAPDRITGQDIIDFSAITCTLTVPFTLTLVSAAGN
ncbi:MAG: SH3 domain-containing protein [Anaerolineae bacterium]